MYKTKMLKKNYEFRRVLSKGNYYSGKYIEAVIISNNKNNNLLGIAISTKTGKAVQRNRVKRLIRENYKNIESRIKDGQNIVFLWKKNKNIKEVIYTDIKEDINFIFDKAKIFLVDKNEKNLN